MRLREKLQLRVQENEQELKAKSIELKNELTSVGAQRVGEEKRERGIVGRGEGEIVWGYI